MKKTRLNWTIKDIRDNQHLISFPEYQREPNVWNLEKKQRLIDSILRDFDIASIYFFKFEDAESECVYDCVDGQQRIKAILSYLGKNEGKETDNGFALTTSNEIGSDPSEFTLYNVKFEDLPEPRRQQILSYETNIVEIDNVENEHELNLLFLRLQLGAALNVGEKLHAMPGEMRDFIFKDIAIHPFFKGIAIPYRRYAREQVAAQIALNYFSVKEKPGQYHRSRYLDLQEFFKKHKVLDATGKAWTQEIKTILDTIHSHFEEKLPLISNRALAVSLFLFVSALLEKDKGAEIGQFAEYLVKLMKTLKWQMRKGINMDKPYQHLLDFQTYVTQAAGERYALDGRHAFLSKGFEYFKAHAGAIEGDLEYFDQNKKKADEEREQIKL